MASFGTAATWLGLSALENGGGVENNVTVYPTQQNEENTASSANSTGADTQVEDAAELAARGASPEGPNDRFLPLGVFSFAPKGEKEAVALVHLAVSKDGLVRGTYYNLRTNKDLNIQGAVDKEDQSVAWTLGPNGKVVYHTSLEDLTDPPGAVTVRTKNGEAQEWTLARYSAADEKQAFDEGQKANRPRQ